ncbi:MAG: hypothetical protein WEA04_01655 [Candidatus Andersenbacteria bacterium]
MPRRLIIGILVVLILGIIGGTVVLIVQRFRGEEDGELATLPDTLPTAEQGQQQIVNPNGDDDNDGLTNAQEVVWGTDPRNPDTDGDGYTDGEEVAANHNPTIPAPNDLLPAGFTPGQDLRPLDEAPLQVDQFFVENLNVQPDPRNLTEEYNRQFSQAERTQETLVTFAQQQPIITNLPAPRPGVIITTQRDSQLTLGHYLDTAGDLDILINRTVISEVFKDLFENDNPATALGLSSVVRSHQQALLDLPVPPAAVELHKLLLGFTELLAATYEQMGSWNEDPVKAMVAINQLDTIDRKYTPLIRTEIDRLGQLADSLAPN